MRPKIADKLVGKRIVDVYANDEYFRVLENGENVFWVEAGGFYIKLEDGTTIKVGTSEWGGIEVIKK